MSPAVNRCQQTLLITIFGPEMLHFAACRAKSASISQSGSVAGQFTANYLQIKLLVNKLLNSDRVARGLGRSSVAADLQNAIRDRELAERDDAILGLVKYLIGVAVLAFWFGGKYLVGEIGGVIVGEQFRKRFRVHVGALRLKSDQAL